MQPTIPSFDTWTSGFLLVVAMGVFLSFLLFSGKNKKVFPIALFIMAFSLILFQYVLYWTGYQFVYPYLVLFPPVCYYLTGPLLFWYFLNLYQKPIPRTLALHFIPSVVLFIPYLFTLFRNIEIYSGGIPFASLPQYYQLIIVHMLVYAGLLLYIVFSENEAPAEYSRIRKKWAFTLATLYTIFIAAYLSYYILVNFSFFNNEWDYAISIMMSISIYTIGYFIFKEPKVFDGEFYATLFLPKANKSVSLEHQLLEELYHKITSYMELKKPYTDNNLRLAHLADQLGFSTHLLSKVINQMSGGNFNAFVNGYRLKDAELLLQTELQTPIKTVYFDVGFNSKASFYNAFKEKHQCTPLEYRQQFSIS